MNEYSRQRECQRRRECQRQSSGAGVCPALRKSFGAGLVGAKLSKGDAVEEPGLQGLIGPGEDSARF